MTDRQDIDALLVGALYGELDSSERARLEAHLSTHPEDRAALDALERTRAQVRRGIEDMPAAEPPPSLSALLLQEAANAAARTTHRGARATAAEPGSTDDQGLWTRFVAWLKPVALNPAYAGAFALLLVAGTATAYYVRSGGQVAEPELRRADNAADTTIAEPTAPPPPSAEGATAGAPATLQANQEEADLESYRVDLDGVATDGDGQADKGAERAKDLGGTSAPKVAKATGAHRQDRAAPGYIEVEKKPQAIDIKEAPAEPSDEELKLAIEDDAVRDRRSRKAASPTMGGAAAVAPQPEPSRAEPGVEQWAQTSHARLKQLVADRKCPEAGRLGAEIKDRAPEYYAANVANDRAIRACKSYIEGQAKKKAAKDYKSRAQTNTVDQSEAPAPTDAK